MGKMGKEYNIIIRFEEKDEEGDKISEKSRRRKWRWPFLFISRPWRWPSFVC